MTYLSPDFDGKPASDLLADDEDPAEMVEWLVERLDSGEVDASSCDSWSDDAGFYISIPVAEGHDPLACHSVVEHYNNGGGWYAYRHRATPVRLYGHPTWGETLALLNAMYAGRSLPAHLLHTPTDPHASAPRRYGRSAPLTQEQKQRIVDAYTVTQSAERVAAEHGVSPTTVTRLVRESGRTVRSPRERKVSPEDRAAIAAAYAAGDSTVVLAERYNLATSSVTDIVTEAGVTIRTRGRRLNADERMAVADAYAQGRPSPDIAREFGISKQTVLSIARSAGVPIR